MYRHALLGEGIAQAVHSRTGVNATVVDATDATAVAAALAAGPDLAVYERTEVIDAIDLGAQVPGCRLIDVSHAVVAGTVVEQCLTGIDHLVALVSGSRA
jgi:ABC-type transporter Mla maintaining outer membrane lipid asymmetry permease subunit MlaE